MIENDALLHYIAKLDDLLEKFGGITTDASSTDRRTSCSKGNRNGLLRETVRPERWLTRAPLFRQDDGRRAPTQTVEVRICESVDHKRVALRLGLIQPFQRLLLLAETGVNQRYFIRGRQFHG